MIDATDGRVIFDAYYYNQPALALSYDEKVILTDDYSGYAFLYQRDEGSESYTGK